MEKYLQILLEQIRCKKAHEFVRQEIAGHITDQMGENISEGMTEQEALEEAVKGMGDPVEAGIALDRIHRPRMEWGIVAVVGLISALSIVLQYFILKDSTVYETGLIIKSIFYSALGLLAMIVVYRFDYSLIGKYAKQIAVIGTLGILILAYNNGRVINNAVSYIGISFINISIITFVFLFVPVYAGILYQQRGGKYLAVLKCIAWMLIPVFGAMTIPNVGGMIGVFLILSVLLSMAVYKGWFQISKRKFFVGFWSLAVILPALAVWATLKLNLLAEYQVERLRYYVSGMPSEIYSVDKAVRQIIKGSKLLGKAVPDITEQVPSAMNSYILTSITAYYGVLAAAAVFGVLLYLVVRIFKISKRQGNQLGIMMGYGCGLVFLVMAVSNGMISIGIRMLSCGDLPFISASGGEKLLSYILAGIVLSIYRYKNILPKETKIQKSNRHLWKMKVQ